MSLEYCANCGHLKSEHYHIKGTYKHKQRFKCHALIWRRGEQKECGCLEFVKKVDGYISWKK